MPKNVKEAYDKMHEYFKELRRRKKETLDYWIRRERKKTNGERF